MWWSASSVQLQDDDTDCKISVVATLDDPTINGVVVCNPDGSELGS